MLFCCPSPFLHCTVGERDNQLFGERFFLGMNADGEDFAAEPGGEGATGCLRISIILATSLLTGVLDGVGVGCGHSCEVAVEGRDDEVAGTEGAETREDVFSDWVGMVVVARGSCRSKTAAATGVAEGRSGEAGVPNA